jgi:hypothetical protein
MNERTDGRTDEQTDDELAPIAGTFLEQRLEFLEVSFAQNRRGTQRVIRIGYLSTPSVLCD